METFIKEIEDKKYKEFIKANVSYLDDIIIYGAYLIQLSNEESVEDKVEFTTMVKILIFREFIEIIDSIKSLFNGNSLNLLNPLLRSLFECAIYIKFMFQENEHIDERAAAYQLKEIYNKIYECELCDSSQDTYKKDKEILAKKLGDNYKEDLREKIKEMESIINKYQRFRELDSTVDRKMRKKINWYSMVSDCNNLRELSRKVDMEAEYLIIYKKLCEKTHIGNIMGGMNIDEDEIKFCFRNPKFPSNPKAIGDNLEIMSAMISQIYRIIINYFLKQEDMEKYCMWYLNKKSELTNIIGGWNGFKRR